MNAERGMRNSEWMTVRLGDVVEIDRNGVDPAKLEPSTAYIGLEHIDSNGSISSNASVASAELRSSKFRFDSRHVLFGKLRPYLRKIARPKGNGVCSTDILPLLPSESIDRDYLFHWLRTDSVVRKATAACSGANLPRLSPEKLRAFEFRVPRSVSAQRRIAAILDKADAIRRKRRESLRLADQFLRSVFLDMFGDPVTNPKGWEDNHLLGSLAEIVSGVTKGRRLDGKTVREVPYLAVVNVQDKYLTLENVKSILATEEEVQRYRLIRDDLLLTEGGDPDKLGRGSLWKEEISECIHQNHVFRVRLTDSRIHPVYLNWLVGSGRGKKYFLRSAKQTTGIASINMTQLRAFPILIPPIKIQTRFSQIVDNVEKSLSILANQTANVNNLFSSLHLRAFQGKL